MKQINYLKMAHTVSQMNCVLQKQNNKKKMAHRWIVFCRRKSLSGNWKTNVGQSILEEVNVFWTNSSSINKSQYFKGTNNNNNRDSEIYAIAKEEILGIPILGFCLQMSETKLNILQVPVQEKYKLWIDQASTLVAVDWSLVCICEKCCNLISAALFFPRCSEPFQLSHLILLPAPFAHLSLALRCR